MEINEQIATIHSKLQQLLKQYDLLLKENNRQTLLIGQLQQEQQEAKLKLEEYQQQNLILKASVTDMDEQDKKQLEQRINQYVKSIDQCISLLSR